MDQPKQKIEYKQNQSVKTEKSESLFFNQKHLNEFEKVISEKGIIYKSLFGLCLSLRDVSLCCCLVLVCVPSPCPQSMFMVVP